MGPFAWAYWIMVLCNVITPQLLWFRRMRNSLLAGVRDLARR